MACDASRRCPSGAGRECGIALDTITVATADGGVVTMETRDLVVAVGKRLEIANRQALRLAGCAGSIA